MAKKFSITTSDDARDGLEQLAIIKGKTAAGLAGFWVEQKVQEARDRGELPQADAQDSTIALTVLNEFLDGLEAGTRYTDKQIEALAIQCDRSASQLRKIRNCYGK